jgi:AraC family transcriptional activator of mtrCDE
VDSLSRLIRLARLEGDVDVRCLLAGNYASDHPAAEPGEVPFHLVLDGRCTVTVGGTSVALAAGDLLLLPHGDAHIVKAAGAESLPLAESGNELVTRQSVGAAPNLDLFCGHYRFARGAGALMFRLMPTIVHVSLDKEALGLADVLRAEASAGRAGMGAIVSALLDAVLTMALRCRDEQHLGSAALWTAMGDDGLGRAISAMIERPSEKWTIDRLAAAAAMSRATFTRRFTTRTGTTVATLLATIRMMLAAELLTHSQQSVSQVARAVGYRSESAFTEAFRCALGVSPSQYRKQVIR